MSRADTAFQESFLSELQRLENGGEVEGPTAVDKLASAIGLDEAPASEDTTYEGMLAKLAERPTPATHGMAAKKDYMAAQRKAGVTPAKPADDSRAYQATLARKAMPAGASMGDKLRGFGARAAHFGATHKKSIAIGAGAAAALGGGYAAYRALKGKKKDED